MGGGTLTAIILIGLAVLIVFLYIFSIGEIEKNENKYDEEFLDCQKEGREE